jgi:DNA-binding transcriptional regulator LsrR (DeoR family)
VWLASDKKGAAERVGKINSRWLGIQWSHFDKCSERAARGEAATPGVIVVAVGAKKANVVKRALGVINHLVIDTELATTLLS